MNHEVSDVIQAASIILSSINGDTITNGTPIVGIQIPKPQIINTTKSWTFSSISSKDWTPPVTIGVADGFKYDLQENKLIHSSISSWPAGTYDISCVVNGEMLVVGTVTKVTDAVSEGNMIFNLSLPVGNYPMPTSSSYYSVIFVKINEEYWILSASDSNTTSRSFSGAKRGDTSSNYTDFDVSNVALINGSIIGKPARIATIKNPLTIQWNSISVPSIGIHSNFGSLTLLIEV